MFSSAKGALTHLCPRSNNNSLPFPVSLSLMLYTFYELLKALQTLLDFCRSCGQINFISRGGKEVILLVTSLSYCVPQVGCILLVTKPPKINNPKSEQSSHEPWTEFCNDSQNKALNYSIFNRLISK